MICEVLVGHLHIVKRCVMWTLCILVYGDFIISCQSMGHAEILMALKMREVFAVVEILPMHFFLHCAKAANLLSHSPM